MQSNEEDATVGKSDGYVVPLTTMADDLAATQPSTVDGQEYDGADGDTHPPHRPIFLRRYAMVSGYLGISSEHAPHRKNVRS